MEEVENPLKDLIKDYEERINNLTESISKKDAEIATLQYAFIGLKYTLEVLVKSTPPPTKKPIIKPKPLPIKEVKSLVPVRKSLMPKLPIASVLKTAATHRVPKKTAKPIQAAQDSLPQSSRNRIETDVAEESKDYIDMSAFQKDLSMSYNNTSQFEKEILKLPNLKQKQKSVSPLKKSKTPSENIRSPGSPAPNGSPEKGFLSKTRSFKMLKSSGSKSSFGGLDESFMKESFIIDEPDIPPKINDFKMSATINRLSKIQNPKYFKLIDEYDLSQQFRSGNGQLIKALKQGKSINTFIFYKNHFIEQRTRDLILRKVKSKLRTIIITSKSGIEISNQEDMIKILMSSVLKLDKVIFTEGVTFNTKLCKILRKIIANHYDQDDSFVKIMASNISMFKKLTMLRFHIKTGGIYPYLEKLNKNLVSRNNQFSLGISMIPDEDNREVLDQMHSLDWNTLEYFKVTINALTPQVYFLEGNMLYRLKQLKISLEIGAKIENMNSLDTFIALESLSITTKLNLKSYQMFFRLCSFPKQITELELSFLNLPAKELFDSSKDFNPHIVKKYENHDIYGGFVRKVERLTDVKKLSLSLQTAKTFEVWNSYILTTLLLHKDRVKYLEINANHKASTGEPFDLEELFNRLSHLKPHLKSLSVNSYSMTFSIVKTLKNIQNLHSLRIKANAEEVNCVFRINNIYEVLNLEALVHFELPILLFEDTYIPLLEKLSEARNLKTLKLIMDGRGLNDNTFRNVVDWIVKLYRLENLEISLKNFDGTEGIFTETTSKIRCKLPNLNTLLFDSAFELTLGSSRDILMKPKFTQIDLGDDGVL